MDTKGIETVRRDNCALVRNVVSTCLNKLLIDRDVEGAAAFAKATISDLLTNRLDLSLLVITKALAKAEYEGKQAHVELAKRMKARDAATAPALGDRVAYVIVKAAKGAKAWEKAEDPVYALDHSLPIDAHHYLDHHLAQPLLRIFEPIMKNPRDLLVGEHTRSVSVSTPSAAAGGIMRFAKVRLSCVGCRALIDEGALCDHCKSKVRELDGLWVGGRVGWIVGGWESWMDCGWVGELDGLWVGGRVFVCAFFFLSCVFTHPPHPTRPHSHRKLKSTPAPWPPPPPWRTRSARCGRSASGAKALCTPTCCAPRATAPSFTGARKWPRIWRRRVRRWPGSRTTGEREDGVCVGEREGGVSFSFFNPAFFSSVHWSPPFPFFIHPKHHLHAPPLQKTHAKAKHFEKSRPKQLFFSSVFCCARKDTADEAARVCGGVHVSRALPASANAAISPLTPPTALLCLSACTNRGAARSATTQRKSLSPARRGGPHEGGGEGVGWGAGGGGDGSRCGVKKERASEKVELGGFSVTLMFTAPIDPQSKKFCSAS